jgi:hypothetical protein
VEEIILADQYSKMRVDSRRSFSCSANAPLSSAWTKGKGAQAGVEDGREQLANLKAELDEQEDAIIEFKKAEVSGS